MFQVGPCLEDGIQAAADGASTQNCQADVLEKDKPISEGDLQLSHDNYQEENSHQNRSSVLPAAAGNTLEAGVPAGNTLPVVVAVAGSSPSAVPAGMGLAVARIDLAAGIGLAADIDLEAGSWDPEEDSNRLAVAGAGRRDRHHPGAGECRSRCRQPGEAEAGCMEADLACRTLCLRSLVAVCATQR